MWWYLGAEGMKLDQTVLRLYFEWRTVHQFSALALLSWQRLSLTVRQHSPLLNVLSACLWLSVLYPEVCHFFLWPADLIPPSCSEIGSLSFLCPQSIPSTLQFSPQTITPEFAIKPELYTVCCIKKCKFLLHSCCAYRTIFVILYPEVRRCFDTFLSLRNWNSNCLLFIVRTRCLSRENQMHSFTSETMEVFAKVCNAGKALKWTFWSVALL